MPDGDRPPHPGPAPGGGVTVLPFAFDQPYAAVSALFGVRRTNAVVEVGQGWLTARFGPWRVRTPLDNVASAEAAGPYTWWRVIGPARLSASDRGLTFASTARGGVCMEFHEPVRGIEPTGRLRHPGLTVTVAEPDELLELLRPSPAAPPGTG